MNVLLVHFPSDKLQAWASFISFPALVLVKVGHTIRARAKLLHCHFLQWRNCVQSAFNGAGQYVNARLNGYFLDLPDKQKYIKCIIPLKHSSGMGTFFWQVITTIRLSRFPLSHWTEKFICPSLFWPVVLGLHGKTLVARCDFCEEMPEISPMSGGANASQFQDRATTGQAQAH